MLGRFYQSLQQDADAPLSRRARVAAYLFFVVLTCVVLFFGLRLDRADLSVPFTYSGDAMLILPMVQSLQEHDTHWHTERLGYPGRLELYDFPVIDHLHFLGQWLIIQLTGSPVVAFNVYHLLTYPLATFCAMWAYRQLGLRIVAAGCAALLFAFTPYHQVRGTGHYYLSAYFLIPPVMVWAIRLADGVTYRFADRAAWLRYLLAVLVACAGAYYAFFSCVLLMGGALYGSVVHRAWKPLCHAALLSAVIVGVGVLNHLPTYQHNATHGKHSNPTERKTFEAELFSLKFTQMMLPISDHRVPALSIMTQRYDNPIRPVQNENIGTPMGLLGNFGFLIGLLAVFLPGDRWRIRAVGIVIMIAFAYGTMGGVGSLFNFVVTPQVRAVNRISIFIAFGSVFLFIRFVDRFYASRTGWARHAMLPAFIFWTCFAIADQTDARWFHPQIADTRDAVAQEWHQDARFFAKLEADCPNGNVFMLPYVPYPEAYLIGPFHGYIQARGFIHTKAMKFSFGAMRGREVDQLHREIISQPLPEMLRRMALHGFDFIVIDEAGYTPELARKTIDALTQELGTPMLSGENGRQHAFDLRHYRAKLIADVGTATWETACQKERDRVRVTFLDGFVSFEPPERDNVHTWCKAKGLMCIHNPSSEVKQVQLSFIPQTQFEDFTTLHIDGGEIWKDRTEINKVSGPYNKSLSVPPGRTFVRFACKPPKGWIARDEMAHVFYLSLFELKQ